MVHTQFTVSIVLDVLTHNQRQHETAVFLAKNRLKTWLFEDGFGRTSGVNVAAVDVTEPCTVDGSGVEKAG